MLIGDFTSAPPPDAQLELAASVLADWCALLDLDPATAIVPHREAGTTRTACPGDAFPMGVLRALVAAELAGCP